MCGRGLSENCLTATIANGPGSLPLLTTVSFRGAYRLTDKGLSAFLYSTLNIAALDLTQCSLLSIAGIKAVAYIIGRKLKSLSLDGCTQLDALELLPILSQMTNLQKLSLSGIGSVKDGLVSELVVVLGSGLEELRLADCRYVSEIMLI